MCSSVCHFTPRAGSAAKRAVFRVWSVSLRVCLCLTVSLWIVIIEDNTDRSSISQLHQWDRFFSVVTERRDREGRVDAGAYQKDELIGHSTWLTWVTCSRYTFRIDRGCKKTFIARIETLKYAFYENYKNVKALNINVVCRTVRTSWKTINRTILYVTVCLLQRWTETLTL